MNTMPLEADTRYLIDKSLENLGWALKGKRQNVFFERAKTERESRLLEGRRPDYVLYSSDKNFSNKPLIVIEAKKKGERLDSALEQGIRYARQLEAPIVFATDGLFCKSYHTGFDRPPILNGEEVDEFLREALALKYLAHWEVNTVSPKVQYDRKELIRIFDEANNMLRGDGLRAGIERFGEFANILFLKLISETEQIKKETGVVSGFDTACHWDAIKDIPASARIDYINNTVYRRLNTLYGTTIFTPLTIRSETILKEIMDKLDPLMLTDVDSDVKGDAFEFFLKESAATKNDLGEYFTPRHIVRTMVKLINPQIGEKIYDPFCGTGGFLIESFRHIWNTMPRNNDTVHMLRTETIYGNEITNTARITKMNMILAGDGHSNIHMQDSLANPIEGRYDIVITNMPYSQKTKYGSLYDLPSNNGDSICVQHCMKAINATAENGRMALVVPEGFLFRKDLARTRELLLKRSNLQSVISLPQGVFLPYTGVKTDIIFATKVNQRLKSSAKRKDFWFFEVKSDGYSLDNHRRKLCNGSDLDKPQEYRKLDEDQRQEMLDIGFESIPIDRVKDNAYILVGSRYREAASPNTTFPLVNLGDERYFDIYSGGTPSSQNDEYWNGSINWITLTDLPVDDYVTQIHSSERTITQAGLNNSNAKMLPVGTVVVSSRATIGRVGVAKIELATNQGFKNIVIKDHARIMPDYVAYAIGSRKNRMLEMASGATFKELSKTNFAEIQIPIPPIDIQKQIVEELDSYQRIIDGARAVVKSYKPRIQIDSKWTVVPLADVCDFEYGYTDVALDEGDARFVRITDINEYGLLASHDKKFVLLNKESKKYLLKRNDILVARIGATFGKTLLYTLETTAVFASYLIRLRFNSEVMPEYYWCFAQSEHYWKQARDLVTGAGQPQFNANAIRLIKLPLPSLDIQKKIVAQIQEEQALIEPANRIILKFSEKIQNRINEIWGE